MTGSGFEAFAREWVDAFNAHDLDRILSHYSDAIELVSPLYLRFTEGRTDAVAGKEALARYFEAALRLYPDLRFDLLEIGEGSRGPCIRYRSNLGNGIAMECFELDSAGRAARVLCHYAPA